jgi:hypothetical protein
MDPRQNNIHFAKKPFVVIDRFFKSVEKQLTDNHNYLE